MFGFFGIETLVVIKGERRLSCGATTQGILAGINQFRSRSEENNYEPSIGHPLSDCLTVELFSLVFFASNTPASQRRTHPGYTRPGLTEQEHVTLMSYA